MAEEKYFSGFFPEDIHKLLEAFKDDKLKLKEYLIEQFVKTETDFLSQEMTDIDELTARYKVKLLTIKERFREAHNIYVEEMDNMCSLAYEKSKEILVPIEKVKKEQNNLSNSLSEIEEKLKNLSTYNLERVLEVLEKFNKLTENQQSLLVTLVKQNEE